MDLKEIRHLLMMYSGLFGLTGVALAIITWPDDWSDINAWFVLGIAVIIASLVVGGVAYLRERQAS